MLFISRLVFHRIREGISWLNARINVYFLVNSANRLKYGFSVHGQYWTSFVLLMSKVYGFDHPGFILMYNVLVFFLNFVARDDPSARTRTRKSKENNWLATIILVGNLNLEKWLFLGFLYIDFVGLPATWVVLIADRIESYFRVIVKYWIWFIVNPS